MPADARVLGIAEAELAEIKASVIALRAELDERDPAPSSSHRVEALRAGMTELDDEVERLLEKVRDAR
jgi:hypothetical protein